jgi:hypothetical protein
MKDDLSCRCDFAGALGSCPWIKATYTYECTSAFYERFLKEEKRHPIRNVNWPDVIHAPMQEAAEAAKKDCAATIKPRCPFECPVIVFSDPAGPSCHPGKSELKGTCVLRTMCAKYWEEREPVERRALRM